MKKAAALFILLLVLLLGIGTASAQEILEYKVAGELYGLNLSQRVLMTVRNNHLGSALTQISYPFSGSINWLKSYDEQGGLESDAEYREGKTYITTQLRKKLGYNETATITADFISPNTVSAFNNTYLLSTAYSLFANVKMFELVLRLPEGTGFKNIETDVVPAPFEITTDGRAILLKWADTNPKEFRIFVRYEPIIPATPEPAATLPPQTLLPPKTPTLSVLLEAIHKNFLPVLFISSLLLILIFYTLFGIKRKKKEEELYNRIEILKEDEQLILKLLAEENGIEQRELQDRTNFSKAKLSKILTELEKRSVIRKESIGKKNKIYLAEKMK